MKKLLMKLTIFSILFLLTTLDAFALGFDVGGKLGIGMGWWRGETYDNNTKDVTGAPDFTIGPYFSAELHKYVALQGELLFTYIGNKDKATALGVNYSRKFRNYAFELPIYIKPKLRLGPGELFLLAGPKFLILLDDFSVSTKTLSDTITAEIESNHGIGRQIHLGISLGVGYDWKLGPGKLQFAFQITPYLTNYGPNYQRAIQNEFTFDFGYAYTVKWYNLLP